MTLVNHQIIENEKKGKKPSKQQKQQNKNQNVNNKNFRINSWFKCKRNKLSNKRYRVAE